MDAPGQQRVVGEVDARDDVGGAERHLLGFGEEVVRVAVQHHAADHSHRHQFFRHDLGGVEDVEAEGLGLLLGEHLNAEFVFGVRAGLDAFPQVAPVVVRVGAGNLHRLVPHQRMGAGLGVPVKLDEHRFARRVDQPEGVHAEALHGGVAARNGAVAHLPHQHVGRFGHQRHEIPEGVVRAGRLRHLVVRLGLDRVHQVGKFHRVLDEEHRHVVADQVPVALVGVELDGEAAHVARRVLGATFARHGGKTHEHRRDLAGFLERRRAGDVGQGLVALEEAVRARAARVHDALGDALVIEVGDLLAQDEVFQQRGAAHAVLERILVVGDAHALVGGEHLARRVHAHAVERLDGGVVAFGRHGAGLGAGVFLRQRAAGGQPRGHVGAGTRLGLQAVGEAVFTRLVGVVRKSGGHHIGFELLGRRVVDRRAEP